ncbi:MAG: Hyaluronan synthase [Syntrophus sp. PtaB.Bin075]|nr:MAG: Hyaluronan synthase [Syntrophus sp. PtaB.Bin075]
MSPKITIYIPVYNGANYIECAIKSVLRQTYKNISLIISDNCSTDETVSIVSKYLYDERITLIKQHNNGGMLKNCNDGLDRIKTEYFMMISHDDYFYSDNALEAGIEILEKNKNIPAVYSYTMFVDDRGRPIIQRKFKYRGLTSGDIVAKKSIIACRNLYGIPLLIRAKSIKELRYSEGFDNSADVDFSISISKGHQIYYVPKSLLAIRFHGNNATARNYLKVIKEFQRMAIKQNIKLSKTELLQMNINHLITVYKKYLFYFYLDNIRR